VFEPLINHDMDQRLTDLHAALSGGKPIAVSYHPAFEHSNTSQPARIWVDIPETGRRLVFSTEMAGSLAEQLTANGFGDAAGLIRAQLPR